MRFALLSAILFVSAFATAEEVSPPPPLGPWDWEVFGTECYVSKAGDPHRPCQAYWKVRDGVVQLLDGPNYENGMHTRSHCGGTCSFPNPNGPFAGQLRCTTNPLNIYDRKGDDYDVEMPSARKVNGEDLAAGQFGTRARIRAMKCVVSGKCECRFIPATQSWLCKAEGNSEFYDGLYESHTYDISGPACVDPEAEMLEQMADEEEQQTVEDQGSQDQGEGQNQGEGQGQGGGQSQGGQGSGQDPVDQEMQEDEAAMEQQMLEDQALMEQQMLEEQAAMEQQMLEEQALMEQQMLEEQALIEQQMLEEQAAIEQQMQEEQAQNESQGDPSGT